MQRLECGDLVEFTPTPYNGDIVFCRTCGKYRTVVAGGIIDEKEDSIITAFVQCLDCTLKRKLTSHSDAEVIAKTHSLRRHHSVLLRSGTTEEIIRSSFVTKT